MQFLVFFGEKSGCFGWNNNILMISMILSMYNEWNIYTSVWGVYRGKCAWTLSCKIKYYENMWKKAFFGWFSVKMSVLETISWKYQTLALLSICQLWKRCEVGCGMFIGVTECGILCFECILMKTWKVICFS